MRYIFLWTSILFVLAGCSSQISTQSRTVQVAEGWAGNAINATIFRANAITTFGDTQYIAFYNSEGYVVLAKRKQSGTDWQISETRYRGNTRDAHNGICIAVDGKGILHMAWDHHDSALRYCRGLGPGSLELGKEMPMTGQNEMSVTYPEFYNLPNGDLLFLYRDGSSGKGRTMLNRYDSESSRWLIVQHPLMDGQGLRNAYTNQIAIDNLGSWHISWCWRETEAVETNHDICYAKSIDQGTTWQNSLGNKYRLPITAQNAEYVHRIAQESDLINQTSMTVNSKGHPMIATYWRLEPQAFPQYHLVFFNGKSWQRTQVGQRTSDFFLRGAGTKNPPISRPKIIADEDDNIYIVFRDDERGARISIAACDDPRRKRWNIADLTQYSVGQWEPSHDNVLWNRENKLHLFTQHVSHGDIYGKEDTRSKMISILEWDPAH